MNDKEKNPKDFPGYPLYPASEDIVHQAERVPADLENASSAKNLSGINNSIKKTKGPEDVDEDLASPPESEFDLTPEDLEALGPKDLSMDMGEDEALKHRTLPVDFAGEDLDVPGTEEDDDREANGSEDEENNTYSIGGDRHEDLEENHSSLNE
jgi:hypothetical protein